MTKGVHQEDSRPRMPQCLASNLEKKLMRPLSSVGWKVKTLPLLLHLPPEKSVESGVD